MPTVFVILLTIISQTVIKNAINNHTLIKRIKLTIYDNNRSTNKTFSNIIVRQTVPEGGSTL